MKERASSCVRAPMSRHCRAASPSAATVSSACTSGEASPYAPNASPCVRRALAERAQPVEDGVGAWRAVLPVRLRTYGLAPPGGTPPRTYGLAPPRRRSALRAHARALVELITAEDGLDVEESPLHRQPRARRRVARRGRRCQRDVDGCVWHRAGRRPRLQQHWRRDARGEDAPRLPVHVHAGLHQDALLPRPHSQPRALYDRLELYCYLPPTHNQEPYDTSLSVIRHKKPLKVRLSRRLNASTGRGAHHTPPPARHRGMIILLPPPPTHSREPYDTLLYCPTWIMSI